MKKLGVFRGMLVSYILIILVPMSLFLYVSIHVVNGIYQQHILGIQTSTLLHSANLLDQRIRECKSYANQISYSPFITRQNLQQAYAGSVAIDQLNSMKSTNEFIGEIGVYYFGDKYIYLSRGAAEPAVASDKCFDLEAEDQKRLLFALNNASEPHLISLRSHGRLFYLIPLPANSANAYGVVLFQFDNAALQSLFGIDSYASNGGHLWAYENGEVLYKTPSTLVLEDIPTAILSDGDWLTLPDGRYRVLRAASQVEPNLYVLTFMNRASLQPLPEKLWLLLLVFITILVVCVYLATLFTSRYWKPFRELGALVIPDVDHTTRWDTIQSAVRATLTKNSDLRRQLEEHMNVMRENLLLRLMEGKASKDDSIADEMREAGLDAALTQGVILAVRIAGEQANLAMRVLRWMNAHHPHDGSAVEIGGVNCVIAVRFLSATHAQDDGELEPRRMAQAIATMLREAGAQRVSIGVGRAMPIYDLRWSYLQAMAALEHGATDGTHIADFGNVAHTAAYTALYAEKQMIISVAVRQGDRALAEQMVCEAVMMACQETPSVYHYVCVSLINWALDSTKEEDTRSELLSLTRLLDRTTPGEFTARLIEVLDTLCREHRAWNEKLDNEYTQSVLHHINQVFTDPNLSLDTLSHVFGSSGAYWSRFFKDRIGESFLDYVWRLRLELAKKLLTTSDLPINEIVEKIGYRDARSFIRKFKASEGATPGQYRKMSQSSALANPSDKKEQ